MEPVEAEPVEAEPVEAEPVEAEPDVDPPPTSPTQRMESAGRTSITTAPALESAPKGLDMRLVAGGAVVLAAIGVFAFAGWSPDDSAPPATPLAEATHAPLAEDPPEPAVEEPPLVEPTPPVPALPVAPAMVERTVISDPLGAEVRIDGELIGETPVTLRVPADGSLQLVLSSRGYDDEELSLSGRVTGMQTVELTRTRRRPSGDDLASQ